jgi:hypothetical protein
MTDLNTGAAPAAAESTSAPVDQTNQGGAAPHDEAAVSTPNPISTKPPEASAETSDKKTVSTREALQKAAAQVKERSEQTQKTPPVETKPKAEDKTDPKAARETAGKPNTAQVQQPQRQTQQTEQQPAQSQSQSKFTAPERFSADAKAAWETAPEPVKAEVHRALRELEQGHQKYKADADAFGEIREYADMAKQHGTSVKDALTRYTGLERRLTSQDPQTKSSAIVEVLRYAGVSPHHFASQILGIRPDQARSQQDDTIYALRRELADLKQQVGGVTSTISEQHKNNTLNEIAKFAENHPRFDELGETIAKLISTGMAGDLAEAYEMADRLSPAVDTAGSQTTATTQTDDLQAQTLKGSKSVAGAPSAGSDPARKGKPSSSIREALRRAQAQVS